MQNALDELPAKQKNAFIMYDLEDVSFEEMSKTTGVAVTTLISRKRHAVLHLRERLETLKNELLKD
ncbi:MAG TPA: sigma factor-like helix-turn-helix DNA-binding protein [Chitinophagaceae bacterium]